MKNGKFEVGDKIRMKHFDKRPEGWNSKGKMDYLMGTAQTIVKVGAKGGYGVTSKNGENGGCWFLKHDHVKAYPEQSIHITQDGNTVHAVLKTGKDVLRRTKAQCAPTDTFDFEIGAELAMSRLWGSEDEKAAQDFKVGDYVRAKKTPDNTHFYTDQNMELGVVAGMVGERYMRIAVIRHHDRDRLHGSIGHNYIVGKNLFEVIPMPRPEAGEWVEIAQGVNSGAKAKITTDANTEFCVKSERTGFFWVGEHLVNLIPPQKPIKRTKTVFCKFKYIEDRGVENYKEGFEWVDACHEQEVIDGEVKGTNGKTYRSSTGDWNKEVEI